MKMKSWLYIAFSFLALVSCFIIFLVKGWGELLGLSFFQTWFVDFPRNDRQTRASN